MKDHNPGTLVKSKMSDFDFIHITLWENFDRFKFRMFGEGIEISGGMIGLIIHYIKDPKKRYNVLLLLTEHGLKWTWAADWTSL